MPLLLDTHVWLWAVAQPERLGQQTTERLVDPRGQLSVATISTLELARLLDAGRVALADPLADWVAASLDLLACDTIALSHAIAAEAHALPPPFHRDPADRVLVATARIHELTLITADERILAYANVDSQDARR